MTYYFLKKKDFKKLEKKKKEQGAESDPGLSKDLSESFSTFYYYLHNYIIKEGVDNDEYKKRMKQLEWMILCCENNMLHEIMDDEGYENALRIYKSKSGGEYPYYGWNRKN